MQHDIVSCSPPNCQSYTDRYSSVSIDCSNRGEKSLPQCLPYPKVSLDYSGNDLKSIEFKKQENIISLSLQRNDITSINGLEFLNDLTELNLSNNSLQSLPPEFLNLKTVKINVQDNPLMCDNCSLIYILKQIIVDYLQKMESFFF